LERPETTFERSNGLNIRTSRETLEPLSPSSSKGLKQLADFQLLELMPPSLDLSAATITCLPTRTPTPHLTKALPSPLLKWFVSSELLQQCCWAWPVSLFLHPGVGWCDSDLDVEPCSFDCEAPCGMEMADIAVMRYEACARDFPDETIENVECCPNGCYCQTSCESVVCDSNTATPIEDYTIPACVEDDEGGGDFSCVTGTANGEGPPMCSSWNPYSDEDSEELCAIYEACAR
jgi:hypothetical protein